MSIRVTALALVAAGLAAASIASPARAEEGLWTRSDWAGRSHHV